jgi:hypothetical protein
MYENDLTRVTGFCGAKLVIKYVKMSSFWIKIQFYLYVFRSDDAWNEHTVEDSEEVAAMVDEWVPLSFSLVCFLFFNLFILDPSSHENY